MGLGQRHLYCELLRSGDWGIVVRYLTGARNISLLQNVKIGSGAHCLLFGGYRGHFRLRQSGRDVQLTSTATSSPSYACTAYIGTTFTYLLTYSIQQSPSWEANRFSVSREIPPHLMEPECSLPQSQVPATCPYPEPDRSSPCPHISRPEDPS